MLVTGRSAGFAMMVGLMALTLCPGIAGSLAETAPTQTGGSDGPHKALDGILDLYVRDGFVYYRALKAERSRLDRYVASLDIAPAVYEQWSRDEQVAFWLNAYNALVLQTIVDHYPIRGSFAAYPPNSIRQVGGAFERWRHRAAGRSFTLDQIETEVLSGFRDPRLYLALGRGAVGSGRLLSEAYTASRLESQLNAVTREFSTRDPHVRVDRVANRVSVTPLFSWREADFVAAYAAAADPMFATRSPIERAILALIDSHLFPSERAFLRENRFELRFHEFDWRLNDLGAARN
jgi:hypothetical protein